MKIVRGAVVVLGTMLTLGLGQVFTSVADASSGSCIGEVPYAATLLSGSDVGLTGDVTRKLYTDPNGKKCAYYCDEYEGYWFAPDSESVGCIWQDPYLDVTCQGSMPDNAHNTGGDFDRNVWFYKNGIYSYDEYSYDENGGNCTFACNKGYVWNASNRTCDPKYTCSGTLITGAIASDVMPTTGGISYFYTGGSLALPCSYTCKPGWYGYVNASGNFQCFEKTGPVGTNYTATFFANGATSISATSATCNTNGGDSCPVVAPSITRNGFTIVGWSTNKNATMASIKPGNTITLDSNKTYYAITSKTNRITYNNNGDSNISMGLSGDSCTVWNEAKNCSVVAPSLIKTGYTVLGWNSNSKGKSGVQSGSTIRLTTNKTYYAITRDNNPLVASFNANGASWISKNSDSCYKYNGSSYCTVTAPDAYRTGYAILGFANKQTATSATVSQGKDIRLTSNKTYYVVSQKTGAMVANFYKNGADSIGANSLSCYIYNTNTACSVQAPSIVRENFNVLGWSTNSNAKSADVSVGQWISLSATGNYYAITAPKNQVGKCTGTIPVYATGNNNNLPSIDTQYFYSTDRGLPCSFRCDTGFMYSGSECVWTGSWYYVTFDKNGAASIGKTSDSCWTTTGQDSCTVRVPTITPKDGYKALGWSTDRYATVANVSNGGSITLSSNKTYYAITTSDEFVCQGTMPDFAKLNDPNKKPTTEKYFFYNETSTDPCAYSCNQGYKYENGECILSTVPTITPVTSDPTAKILKMDITNAVQHIKSVKFIDKNGGTGSAILSMVGARMLGVQTDNFVISQEGSKKNSIDNSSLSTILGGSSNSIVNGTGNTVLGGSGNTNYGNTYSTILGGSYNSFGGATWRSNLGSVIVGGLSNHISGSTSLAKGLSNRVYGDNGVALGNGNMVSGNGSVGMGLSGTVSSNNSFLWSDGTEDVELLSDNVFAVMSAHGMVINASKAHSFAKLTVGGPLILNKSDKDPNACDSSTKGIIKVVDGDSNQICLCGCDGEAWHSLYGQGRCEGMCNVDLHPVCGSTVYKNCDARPYSFEGTCEVGKPVNTVGSYLITKDNIVHWSCQTDDGAIAQCSGSAVTRGGTCNDSVGACQGADINNAIQIRGNDGFVNENKTVYSTRDEAESHQCSYICRSGYHKEGNQCLINQCQGSIPYNATGNSWAAPAVHNTSYYHYTGGAAPCSYSCNSGYVYSGNECVILNGCLGSVPDGAILLPGSDSDLTGYVNIKLYADYSAAQGHKCAYYCDDWHYFVADYMGGSICLHKLVEYQCLGSIPEHATLNTQGRPNTGDVNYFYASGSSAPCSYTCNSGYVFTGTNVSAGSCITGDVVDNTQPNNTTTYKCTGSVPNGASANNDKKPTNRDIAYYYSTNVSDPCTYKCSGNRVWNGSSCETQTIYSCVGTYPSSDDVVVNSTTSTHSGTAYSFGNGECSFTCKDRSSEGLSFHYQNFNHGYYDTGNVWHETPSSGSGNWIGGCAYQGGYASCYWSDNVSSNHTVVNNYNMPDENTAYYYSPNTSDLCTFSCEAGYAYTGTTLSGACVGSGN